jgi:hypothetical protein
LDLNTTAKKEIKRAHISSGYLDNGSFIVLTFDLSRKIGPYIPPKPIEEVPPVVDNKTKISPTAATAQLKKAAAATKESKESKDSLLTKESKGVRPKDDKSVGVLDNVLPPIQSGATEPKPTFERAVYLFPYKCSDLVPQFQAAVAQINLEAFKQTNPLFISTKALTEEEKKDIDLDIITGFEFIDSEFRTYIIEGISDKGMKRLEQLYPRLEPNTDKIKIMKNSDIRFKERLYSVFNIDIKRVRVVDICKI